MPEPRQACVRGGAKRFEGPARRLPQICGWLIGADPVVLLGNPDPDFHELYQSHVVASWVQGLGWTAALFLSAWPTQRRLGIAALLWLLGGLWRPEPTDMP